MAAPSCDGQRTVGEDRSQCTTYNGYVCPAEDSAINGVCLGSGKHCYSQGYYYAAQNCWKVAPEAFVDRDGGGRTHDEVGEKEWPANSWNGKWQICPEGWAAVERFNAHGSRYNVRCKKMVPNAMDEGGSTSHSTNWNGPTWASGPVGADSNTNVNLCPAGQVATRLLPYNMGCRRVKPGQAGFVADMARNVE